MFSNLTLHKVHSHSDYSRAVLVYYHWLQCRLQKYNKTYWSWFRWGQKSVMSSQRDSWAKPLGSAIPTTRWVVISKYAALSHTPCTWVVCTHNGSLCIWREVTRVVLALLISSQCCVPLDRKLLHEPAMLGVATAYTLCSETTWKLQPSKNICQQVQMPHGIIRCTQ